MTNSIDTAQLTFEQAMEHLEALVKQLEAGNLSLEEAIAAYEKGSVLKKYCQQHLKEAKMRVDKITIDETDQPGLKPFESVA